MPQRTGGSSQSCRRSTFCPSLRALSGALSSTAPRPGRRFPGSLAGSSQKAPPSAAAGPGMPVHRPRPAGSARTGASASSRHQSPACSAGEGLPMHPFPASARPASRRFCAENVRRGWRTNGKAAATAAAFHFSSVQPVPQRHQQDRFTQQLPLLRGPSPWKEPIALYRSFRALWYAALRSPFRSTGRASFRRIFQLFYQIQVFVSKLFPRIDL